MKDMNRFGKLLKDCREKSGLSQEQLAALLNVERSTVSRWESGDLKRRPHDLRNKLLKCFKDPGGLHFYPETGQELFISAGLHPLDNEELTQVSNIKSDFCQNTADPIEPSPTNFSQKSSETENLAENIFADYIKELFPKLQLLTPHPVMLLLNQAHWDEPPCRKAILAQAEKNYPFNAVVVNLSLPSNCVNVDDFFAKLAQNSGIMSVNNGYGFKKWLELQLQPKGNRLFLLVSRFDKAGSLLAEELASMIRNFSETYSERFHVMLCGGEKLADLKYQSGLLSLLNFATVEYWPELGIKEVKALYQCRYEKEKELDDQVAEDLLKISGGHPQLLNQCFLFQRNSPNDWRDLTDYSNKLSKTEEVWQLFTPLTEKDDDTVQRLCELLERKYKPLLSYWQPYIPDKLLRELYWRNLLVWRDKNDEPDEKELYWRCEAVRMAGEQIFRRDKDGKNNNIIS